MKKEIFYCTIISAIVFVVSSVLGYFYATSNPGIAMEIFSEMGEDLSFIKDLNSFELFALIFANNSFSMFFALITGVAFGVIPFLFMVINGGILGIVVSLFIDTAGVKGIFLLLAPHGIIELPAAMMASGLGIFLGYNFIKQKEMKPLVKKVLIFFVKVIIPLVFIAALIESFITPLFI